MKETTLLAPSVRFVHISMGIVAPHLTFSGLLVIQSEILSNKNFFGSARSDKFTFDSINIITFKKKT